jgi:hypothetical protein
MYPSHTPTEFLSTEKIILKLLNKPLLHFLQILRHDTLPPNSKSFVLCQAKSKTNLEELFYKENIVGGKTVEAKLYKRSMTAVS